MNDTAGDPIIITVDGTSSSGKGTLAEGIATALGIGHLDSGLLYRLVSAEVSEHINKDFEKCLRMLRSAIIEYLPNQQITFNGALVTNDILRSPKVDSITPSIAQKPEIREIIRGWQHTIAQAWGKAVVEGRDIGTVVFPNAQAKIYLDADVELRAQWRQAQHARRGSNESLDDVLKSLSERDHTDIHREKSSLRPADDAYILDASNKTPAEVLTTALDFIRTKVNI